MGRKLARVDVRVAIHFEGSKPEAVGSVEEEMTFAAHSPQSKC